MTRDLGCNSILFCLFVPSLQVLFPILTRHEF